MDILFITNTDINDCTFGGGKGARSCYELLCRIGKTDIQVIKKQSSFCSALSVLQGYYPPLTGKEIEKTNRACRKKKPDVVFLNTSVYGAIAKALKKEFPELLIFAMFQNCELDYNAVRFIGEKGIKSRIYKILVRKSEAMTLRYCDYNAALSKRDAMRLKKLYGARIDYILPLFIRDDASREDLKEHGDSGAYCLIFGPDTPPNVQGARWFAENVSPYLNIKTLIAGNGMDRLADELRQDNVDVAGYVENIHELYQKACCVCLPLFSGGGMKVKTIEAMMFGKKVFGTKEAFSGYGKIDKEAGIQCDTPEEFIRAVNSFVQSAESNFCVRSRELYEEKYSQEAAFLRMRRMLSDITKRQNQ